MDGVYDPEEGEQKRQRRGSGGALFSPTGKPGQQRAEKQEKQKAGEAVNEDIGEVIAERAAAPEGVIEDVAPVLDRAVVGGKRIEEEMVAEDFETEDGEAGSIRFEGIVAIKELDDPPTAGAEVWHEYMSPDPARPSLDDAGELLPPVYPEEMAFPRARDD